MSIKNVIFISAMFLFFILVSSCNGEIDNDKKNIEDQSETGGIHTVDDDQPQPPSWCAYVASMGDGQREDCHGTTVLHVRGTPYEIGYQTGALMREEITDLIHLVRTYIDPFGYLWSLLQGVQRIIDSEIRPEYLEEMQGLTDGLNNDVTYEEILTGNVLGDIFGTIRAIMDNVLDLDFCSLAAAWGDATTDGEMIVMRNFDYMNIFASSNYVAVVEPDEGHAFVTTGIAGIIGIHAGMNDAGLTGALAYNSSWDSDMSGVPMLLLLREAVQYNDNIEDAENVIIGADRTMGLNYMFTNAFDGTVEILEVSQDKWAKRAPEDADYIFATNHYVDSVMRHEQRGYEPEHTSMVRYARLGQLFEENFGSIDLVKSAAIMRDHYDSLTGKVAPSRVTVCRHDDVDYPEGSLMNQFVSTTTPSILMKPIEGEYCTTVTRHACDRPYFCFKPFE